MFVKLAENKRYDRFILVLMILNAVFLGIKFIGMPSYLNIIISYSSYFFLAIYNID